MRSVPNSAPGIGHEPPGHALEVVRGRRVGMLRRETGVVDAPRSRVGAAAPARAGARRRGARVRAPSLRRGCGGTRPPRGRGPSRATATSPVGVESTRSCASAGHYGADTPPSSTPPVADVLRDTLPARRDGGELRLHPRDDAAVSAAIVFRAILRVRRTGSTGSLRRFVRAIPRDQREPWRSLMLDCEADGFVCGVRCSCYFLVKFATRSSATVLRLSTRRSAIASLPR